MARGTPILRELMLVILRLVSLRVFRMLLHYTCQLRAFLNCRHLFFVFLYQVAMATNKLMHDP